MTWSVTRAAPHRNLFFPDDRFLVSLRSSYMSNRRSGVTTEPTKIVWSTLITVAVASGAIAGRKRSPHMPLLNTTLRWAQEGLLTSSVPPRLGVESPFQQSSQCSGWRPASGRSISTVVRSGSAAVCRAPVRPPAARGRSSQEGDWHFVLPVERLPLPF